MIELMARGRLWMAAAIALGVTAGLAAWLLVPRPGVVTGGNESGDVAFIAVILYLLLAGKREELSPAVRRVLAIAVGVVALAGAVVLALAR